MPYALLGNRSTTFVYITVQWPVLVAHLRGQIVRRAESFSQFNIPASRLRHFVWPWLVDTSMSALDPSSFSAQPCKKDRL